MPFPVFPNWGSLPVWGSFAVTRQVCHFVKELKEKAKDRTLWTLVRVIVMVTWIFKL